MKPLIGHIYTTDYRFLCGVSGGFLWSARHLVKRGKMQLCKNCKRIRREPKR